MSAPGEIWRQIERSATHQVIMVLRKKIRAPEVEGRNELSTPRKGIK